MSKKKHLLAPVTVPADRVSAIAAQLPPTVYCDVGGRSPRHSRRHLFKQAMAIMEHGERVPIAIKNMSATGLRVEYFQNRTLGERIFLVEPSIPLRVWTEVVWEQDGAAGLRFMPDAADKSS